MGREGEMMGCVLFWTSVSSLIYLDTSHPSREMTYRLDRNDPRSSSFPSPLSNMDERVIELVKSVLAVIELR